MTTETELMLASQLVRNKYSLSNRCCNGFLLFACSINAILQFPCTVAYTPVALAFMFAEKKGSKEGAEKFCCPIENLKMEDSENKALSCCLTLFAPFATSARALEVVTGPYHAMS